MTCVLPPAVKTSLSWRFRILNVNEWGLSVSIVTGLSVRVAFALSVTNPFNSMSHVPFPSLPILAQWCPNIHSRRPLELSPSLPPYRLNDSKKAVGRSNCTDRNISHSIQMLRQCYLFYAVRRYFLQISEIPFRFFLSMKIMSAVNVCLPSPYCGHTAAVQFVCKETADKHTSSLLTLNLHLTTCVLC